MELPTMLTTQLMFVLVSFLAVAPFFSAYGTFRIGRVYYSDRLRPRNRLLRRMFHSGLAISLAGFYVTALCVEYLRRFFDAKPDDPVADFGGVTFALVLIIVMAQPFLNWMFLRRMKPRSSEQETQDQAEDREFGERRRELEVEHNLELDKQK